MYREVGWRGVCSGRLHSVLFKESEETKRKHKRKEYNYTGGKCEGRESKPAKPFARGWVRFGGNSKDSLG